MEQYKQGQSQQQELELRRRDRWMYNWFGPTIVHYQHELYLLISLSCLTISSLQALYKSNFPLAGDYQYILLSTLWLSRYLILRWLCTWDTSTNRRPSIAGVVSHWITSHFMAGQYFDRPNPYIVTNQIGNIRTDDAQILASFASFFPPSVLYTVQLLKVRIFYPLVQVLEFLWEWLDQTARQELEDGDDTENDNPTNRPMSTQMNARRMTHYRLYLTKAYTIWNEIWTAYGPPLQMIIPVATMTFYLWYLFFSASDPAQTTYALTMNTRTTQPDQESYDFDIKPYGAYKKLPKPQWPQVLFFLSCGGTLVSILLYGRIFLPIYDLVAGSNVLKAVRNEAKSSHGGHSSGSKNTSKSKSQKESQDAWAEQYKSIVGENRFRLMCKVAFVRIIESLFVCALLPRTSFCCRATDHCSENTPIWTLSKVLYPVGITTPLRSDGRYQNQFALITPDRGSAIMTVLSVFLITACLLLSQAATLHRSYLSIMGYIAGEWTVVDESELASTTGSTPSQWDPRRRYKKGDLIVQNFPGLGGQTIYKATSNSPEGRPFDLYLRATHDLFRNEVGHAETSKVISMAAMVQLLFMAFLTIIILWYLIVGYDARGLLWTLAANVIAAYGTMNVGLQNHSELEKLAKQIQ